MRLVAWLILAAALAFPARAQEVLPNSEPIRMQLFPSLPLEAGHKSHVTVKLSRVDTGKVVTMNELKDIDGKALRLHLIDQSLSDYQSFTPEPTGQPGEFAFDFVPARKGAYRAWGETVLVKDNSWHLSRGELGGLARADAVIDKKPITLAAAGKYFFAFGFETVPRAGKATNAVLVTTDREGKPYPPLFDSMGSTFGEMIAFSEDFVTLMKLKPLEKSRPPGSGPGGPGLHFRFEPPRPGYYKLFARVSIKGREILVPLNVSVQGSEE